MACLYPSAQNASNEYLPNGWYNFIQLTPLNIFFNGSFAVYIFFTISAFLLTRSYFLNPEPKLLAKKYVSKFVRIVTPVLIISTIAYLLLKCGLYFHVQAGSIIENSFWINERDYEGFSIWGYLIDILWRDWQGTSQLIPPLWTMMFDFLGTIIVTMLLATGQGKNKKLLFLILFLLFGAGSAMYACFIFGMLLAIVYENQKENCFGIAFFIIGIIMGAYPPTGTPTSGMYYHIYEGIISEYNTLFNLKTGTHVWYTISAFLIIYGAIKSNIIQKIFSCRAFKFLGSISMYVYICHIPIIWSFGALVFYKFYYLLQNFWLASIICFVLSVAVTIICSFILKKFIDKYLAKRLSSLTNKLLK